ncbi:MAG: acetyl-CoA carboxylase biotin carboxyl carrier protein [Fastidiosipilaceae bacterium]|nr:acetyl-CoA carboxylase biotin carboxyl carrier protein [Clostridiaceae bacterium]
MDIEKVKSLMQEMTRCGLSELEWEGEGVKLKLKRETAAADRDFIPMTTSVTGDPSMSTVGQDHAASNQKAAELNGAAKDELIDEASITVVKSPVIGVFYAAASPEAKPYIEVGQKVKKGDVLCIIEAMKLMNEVLSEVDGEILKILVSDGEKVEYGQPLIKIG